jgi:flagellar motor protein MotB
MRNRRNRHTSETEIDTEGSWAISYGDMVTLLLTFFIIFFTIDKFQIQKSMKLDISAKHEQQGKDMAKLLSSVLSPDKKVKDDVHGKVYQSGQRVIVEFTGVSFFQSGEVVLGLQAQQNLKHFYRAFSPHMGQYTLAIHAYTDSRKVKASKRPFQDNLELSALRSVSVMRYLQKSGVPLDHMTLGGYGELRLRKSDLDQLPTENRKPSSLNELARTAVLIIEPREEK